jgi:hypothetical protein
MEPSFTLKRSWLVSSALTPRMTVSVCEGGARALLWSGAGAFYDWSGEFGRLDSQPNNEVDASILVESRTFVYWHE